MRLQIATTGAVWLTALAQQTAAPVREQFERHETWPALRIAGTGTGTVSNIRTVLVTKAGARMSTCLATTKTSPAPARTVLWTVEEGLADPLGPPNCAVVLATRDLAA